MQASQHGTGNVIADAAAQNAAEAEKIAEKARGVSCEMSHVFCKADETVQDEKASLGTDSIANYAASITTEAERIAEETRAVSLMTFPLYSFMEN